METHQAHALAAALDERIRQWEGESFTARALPPQLPVEIAVPDGLPADARAPFLSSMQRILRLSKIAIAASGTPAAYRVETSFALQSPGTSGQSARMTIRLLDDQ